MKKKKYIVYKGEKLLAAIIVFFIVGTLFVNFIGKARLQSNNAELQRLKAKVDTQEKMNASIQMKINELSSLDKIESVATSYGLEYNNNNIKIISE
jgi:cell division protein FtsL